MRATVKSILKIAGMALVMGVVATVVKWVCQIFLNPDSKTQALLIILIVAAFGGFTYMVLALKTRIADKLLGERVAGIRRRLRMR